MGQEEFETLLNFFKALGNESRLKIIGILANRECTVRELATLLDLKEPTVSQHLNMLKDAGLVAMHPEGNHHFYSLNVSALTSMNKDVFSRAIWRRSCRMSRRQATLLSARCSRRFSMGSGSRRFQRARSA